MSYSGSLISALLWHSGGWVWRSTSGTRRKYFPVGLYAASLPHTVPKAAPQTLAECLLPVSFFRTYLFPNFFRIAPRRVWPAFPDRMRHGCRIRAYREVFTACPGMPAALATPDQIIKP